MCQTACTGKVKLYIYINLKKDSLVTVAYLTQMPTMNLTSVHRGW